MGQRVDLEELKQEYRYISNYETNRRPLFFDGCMKLGEDRYGNGYYECNGVLFVPECHATEPMITVDKKMIAYTKYAYEARQLEYNHRQANTDWFPELREMLYEYTEGLKEEAEIGWIPSLKDTAIYPVMIQEIKALINKYSEVQKEFETDYGYLEVNEQERLFTSCSRDIDKLKRKDQKEVIQIKAVGDDDTRAIYIGVGNSLPASALNTLAIVAYILARWNNLITKKPIKGVPAL